MTETTFRGKDLLEARAALEKVGDSSLGVMMLMARQPDGGL